MPPEQPSGTVTLVFSDIEGSTKLLHELGAEAYREALAEHRAIVREAYARYSGYEVDYEGDAFFYTFASASDALSAVSEAMAGLEGGSIRIRVGIHSGEPVLDPPKYVGMDVHFAARVMSCAHGGQVVVSSATRAACDDRLQAALASLGSHRLKDISEPVSLYQLGEGSFPALRTIANSNLPTPASSFVGRESELVHADHLLQETRLLTIHGPGGQGKTRFALELATRARAERFSDYPDGVFSCFLASLRDPALVLPTIAQTLSVREQPGLSALDALTSHLQGKKLLLLLDNLEHLLEAASELSQVLSACPSLTLLVTSRELLRIQGEAPYALSPLAEEEGIALFCERAKTEPSETIAEIAERLEGLPLAIELAAARTRILSPAQLLERLGSRLDLLKGGRDADPRQQTLRATIEWSYDLLTPEEQELFARLSVFAGGCALEAAEEVCDAGLDSLQSLVDKSLLRFTDDRFWMLESIREYAGEALADTKAADSILRKFATAMAASTEHADALGRGPDVMGGTALIQVELSNIRAALDWSAAHEATLLHRLATAMWLYWYGPGSTSEGLEWIGRALDSTPALERKCILLGGASWLQLNRGDLHTAERIALERLQVATELGDQSSVAGSYALLGLIAEELGQIDEAADYLEKSSELGDDYKMRFNLATFLVRHGRHDEGLTLLDDVSHAARSAGDEHMVTLCSVRRTELAIDSGRPKEALRPLAEAIRFFDGTLNTEDCLDELGRALIALGRESGGVRLLGAAEAIRRKAELELPPSDRARLQSSLEQVEPALRGRWYEEGLNMSLEEAVDLALASID
jgi:predicted ATPase/class 3 adenylate cyclase